jgi:hypothetical protein
MSGPKVVRIVTREELIANCEKHLARLEAALQRWEKVGRRNGLLSDEEIKRAHKRSAELRSLLAVDQFTKLQQHVPDEIAHFKADMERRLSEAAARAAAARLYGSRLAAMAQQILDRCARGEKSISDTQRRELQAVVQSKGADRERAEKVLAAALASGIAGAAMTLTPEQRALAERLRGDERAGSLEEWLQDNVTETDAFALKADKAIEELSLVAGEEEAAPLAARYRAVLAEPVGRRRQMLADTLMLDAGRALAGAKATAEALRALELEAVSLSSIDRPQARELAQRISAAVAARDTSDAKVLTKQVTALVEQERKALAAKALRSAIVNALKELGYEVREGMETAAPQDGKVILRRAANAEMGVEVAGIHGGGRVQFRPVRFGSSASASDQRKDRDIERIWCSDFERLKEKISRANGNVEVQHARAVGEVPVLVVTDDMRSHERRPEIVRSPAQARLIK